MNLKAKWWNATRLPDEALQIECNIVKEMLTEASSMLKRQATIEDLANMREDYHRHYEPVFHTWEVIVADAITKVAKIYNMTPTEQKGMSITLKFEESVNP